MRRCNGCRRRPFSSTAAGLHRSTEIRVSGTARLIAMDWLILGRSASGETVRQGAFRDDWRVYRDGRLIWADAFRLSGDIADLVQRPSLLAGHTAIATILYAASNAAAHLTARAQSWPARVQSRRDHRQRADDLPFRRKAAAELRRAVTDFLRAFRDGLEGFTAALPRVWAC